MLVDNRAILTYSEIPRYFKPWDFSLRYFQCGHKNAYEIPRVKSPENSRVILRFFYLREWPLASFVMWIRWLEIPRSYQSRDIWHFLSWSDLGIDHTDRGIRVCFGRSSNSVMRRNVSSSCRRTKYLKSLERRSFSSRHRRSLTILRKNDDLESILILEQLLQDTCNVIQICNGEFRYKSTDCMHAGQLNKRTHVYIHVCILWRDKHTHITLRGTGTVVSQTPELKTLVNNRSVTGRAP